MSSIRKLDPDLCAGAEDGPDVMTRQSNRQVEFMQTSEPFKASPIAMYVSQHALVDFLAKVNRGEEFVQSPSFHLTILVVAALNIFAIGFEMDMGSSRFFEGLKLAFFAVYLLEIVLRAYAIGVAKLFKKPDLLILVDLLVITCIGTDVVMKCVGKETMKLWSGSILKLLRLFSIISSLSLRSGSHELVFFVRSLRTALLTSLWGCLLLGSFIYISSLLIIKVLSHCHAENEVTYKYWGTIPRSSLTLLAVATGQWEGMARDLWDINPGMLAILVAFVILVSMAILNLLIATTIESTLRQAVLHGGDSEDLAQKLEGIRDKVALLIFNQDKHDMLLSQLQDSMHVTRTEEQKPMSPSSSFSSASTCVAQEQNPQHHFASSTSASTSVTLSSQLQDSLHVTRSEEQRPPSPSPSFSSASASVAQNQNLQPPFANISSASTSVEPSSRVWSNYWLLSFEADETSSETSSKVSITSVSHPALAKEPVWLAKHISPQVGSTWTWQNCKVKQGSQTNKLDSDSGQANVL